MVLVVAAPAFEGAAANVGGTWRGACKQQVTCMPSVECHEVPTRDGLAAEELQVLGLLVEDASVACCNRYGVLLLLLLLLLLPLLAGSVVTWLGLNVGRGKWSSATCYSKKNKQ